MIHRIPENSYRNYIDTILPYNMVTLGYKSWRAKSWPIAKIVKGKTVADASSEPCINSVKVASKIEVMLHA